MPHHPMATSGHPQQPQQHLFLLGTWHSPTQQSALPATQLDLQQQVPQQALRPCRCHSSGCCSRRRGSSGCSSRFHSLPATAAAGSARRTWLGQQPALAHPWCRRALTRRQAAGGRCSSLPASGGLRQPQQQPLPAHQHLQHLQALRSFSRALHRCQPQQHSSLQRPGAGRTRPQDLTSMVMS
jgi:hypothetical protein